MGFKPYLRKNNYREVNASSRALRQKNIFCAKYKLIKAKLNKLVEACFCIIFILLFLYTKIYTSAGAGSRTRTGTVFPPADFESAASTNFATPAGSLLIENGTIIAQYDRLLTPTMQFL